MHACMHTYIHRYIHAYIHACMQTCMHAYLYTYINTYIQIYTSIYLHLYIHTYIHIHVRVYIYIDRYRYRYARETYPKASIIVAFRKCQWFQQLYLVWTLGSRSPATWTRSVFKTCVETAGCHEHACKMLRGFVNLAPRDCTDHHSMRSGRMVISERVSFWMPWPV